MSKNYIPQKQDLVWLDFDLSADREIQKRRPALVISSQAYARQTGFVAVCPITHGQEKLEAQNLLVDLSHPTIDGFVNPFQLHTFDYRARNIQKIGQLDTEAFQKVVQLYQYIFED
ncbi:type II toxin-antitoxin system PemK/MazF family toxin [Streptococcus mutans]|uniref:type II toxin-antitoxin system PemK/MazF family toxin n=1 Tax=Streptococcus mutans TaxID=1309 RepID=UPI0002B58632|nr:type II toxin-antitoxin system PemK/MazF family toxin [Streptococcus mutans]EMC00728.1 transcriptional regulator [Streptococcus mutans T4]